MEFLFGLIVVFYIVFNIYVTKRINKAIYLKEERRRLHKILIWIIPYLGPLMIRGFWKKRGELEVITKDQRKKGDSNHFHESGKGMYM